MQYTSTFPDALPTSSGGESNSPSESLYAPVPTAQTFPVFKSSSSLTPLVCDERAITRLLETIIARSGLSVREIARRLGVAENSVRQYSKGKRNRPSLIWFVRLAELCGCKISIEFPRAR